MLAAVRATDNQGALLSTFLQYNRLRFPNGGPIDGNSISCMRDDGHDHFLTLIEMST